MKRWVALSLLLIPLLASAESFWEGSAALQRGDATFESSLSAASNSFAPDTRVLVQNLETGQEHRGNGHPAGGRPVRYPDSPVSQGC